MAATSSRKPAALEQRPPDAPARTTVGALTRRHMPSPRRVFAISSLGVFVAFVDATIVNIAFPDIHSSFPEASISTLSWILSGYNIVFAAFLVAAGRVADLIGRKRMFVWGLALFTLASGLCAIAPSVETLIAARLIQALGAAVLIPSALALVLEAFSYEHRAHAVALSTAVGALAAGIGPPLGGLLVSAGDWRLVFLVNIPIGIAGIVLARRHLVESRAPGRRRIPDLLGSALFALAIALLVFGIVKGPDWGWTDPRVLGAWLAALVLGAVVVRRCQRHRSPIIDLTLLRIRSFTVANVATILAAAGFFGYTLVNVLFLTSVWGYSVLEAGLAMTPGPFVAAAVAAPTSRLVERFGRRAVLVPGGLIWGFALLWMVTQVGTTPEFVSEWLPGMVLLGIGAGMMLANVSGAAVASAPGEEFGTATALNSVARQVGAALGVAVVVAVIGEPSPAQAAAAFDDAWTYAAAGLFASGLICIAIGRGGQVEDGTEVPSLAQAAREVIRGSAPPEPETLTPPAPRAPRSHVAVDAPQRAETVADFLAQVPIFAGLSEPLRERLAKDARAVHFAAGNWLFREGDDADCLFVVRAGRLEIVAEGPDSAVLRVLRRGDALGELALLTESPRSASARAARDSDLIAIDRESFEALLDEAPELSRSVSRALARQLRASRAAAETLRPRPATVALVPLSEGVRVTEIAARLGDALSEHGTVATLDSTVAPRPRDGAEMLAAYGPALDRAEAVADVVVLVGGAPGQADPWTDFCLQQADRVLALTRGGEIPPAVRERPELRGCDLVAFAVEPGSGALAGWADALDPVETHALPRAALDAGLERMARRLTGNSVGVVLSGGGARALSHIGVIEELLAAGVRIDRVGGVSMGAFIGGMLAAGMAAEEIDARCYDEWVRRRPLADYTLPRHSLIRGARVEAMLERTFGRLAIEELERSFFCASGELRSGELVLHRWGALVERVGESIALPILGPPVKLGRRILVDGSLVDNLPVGAMAQLGEGPVIAVDVKVTIAPEGPRSPGAPLRLERQAARREERLRLGTGDKRRTGRRYALGSDRPPPLGETLMRVLLLGSSKTSEAARRYADLTIAPRNDGIGLLEFHQIDRAREAGREAARAALEDAPAQLFS